MFYLNIKATQHQFLKEILKEKSEEIYDEYLRLLYVAMTRAENELYICGFNDQNISENSWYNLAKKAIFSKAIKEDFIDADLGLNDEKLVFADKPDESDQNLDDLSFKKEEIEKKAFSGFAEKRSR